MLGGVRVADSYCLVACNNDDPTEFCGTKGYNNFEGHAEISIYQDTSAPPVDFQSCLESKIVGDVILRPVFQNSSSVPNVSMLSGLSDATFPPGFNILSVSTCSNLDLHEFNPSLFQTIGVC